MIITPESTHKGGWENIAHKISMFIYEPTEEQEPQNNIVRQLGASLKEAFNSNRWMTKKKTQIQPAGDHIRITGGTSALDNELFNYMYIRKFQNPLQLITGDSNLE